MEYVGYNFVTLDVSQNFINSTAELQSMLELQLGQTNAEELAERRRALEINCDKKYRHPIFICNYAERGYVTLNTCTHSAFVKAEDA